MKITKEFLKASALEWMEGERYTSTEHVSYPLSTQASPRARLTSELMADFVWHLIGRGELMDGPFLK